MSEIHTHIDWDEMDTDVLAAYEQPFYTLTMQNGTIVKANEQVTTFIYEDGTSESYPTSPTMDPIEREGR